MTNSLFQFSMSIPPPSSRHTHITIDQMIGVGRGFGSVMKTIPDPSLNSPQT